MYLVLGDKQDPWCPALQAELKRRGHQSLIVVNPFADPSRFQWRLDNTQSTYQVILDGRVFQNEDIDGVFVRSSGWIDPAGWQADDLSYMQSETQAALIAWLWALECPVVNRYPASIWYHPYKPLLLWYSLLRKCGLPAPVTILTNIEAEARDFGDGLPGVTYEPLTGSGCYLVANDSDWAGLTSMMNCAPVTLASPHGKVHSGCLVDRDFIWDDDPPIELTEFEAAIHRFAEAAGLTFLELAFAQTESGYCVSKVEPFPRYENFGESGRGKIITGLAGLLTSRRGIEAAAIQRSLI
jgi:hypothetical protein